MREQPRIGIDYTAGIHQRAGIGRYVRALTVALAAQAEDGGAGLRLFAAGMGEGLWPAPPGKAVYKPAAMSERTFNRLWHRLRLPLPVERWTGPVDLFHAMDFTLPPTRRQTKTVLTIHDLAFERYPDETMPGMLGYLRTVVPRSVAKADRVIAVSAATKRDLVDLYGASPEKIAVVRHGVETRFGEEVSPENIEKVRERYRLPEGPIVLTVGTMQPRKNHLRLVEAFAPLADRATLVIAGGRGWDYEAVYAAVEKLGLKGRVRFTGFVDDYYLPALYRAAAVFAYPSLYEGFGLPVLEAMAAGAPVLASNASSLPEAVGEAGLLVDPLDVAAIRAGLTRLLDDGDLRVSLAAGGRARAATFTWEQAAVETWNVYDSLLAG